MNRVQLLFFLVTVVNLVSLFYPLPYYNINQLALMLLSIQFIFRVRQLLLLKMLWDVVDFTWNVIFIILALAGLEQVFGG